MEWRCQSLLLTEKYISYDLQLRMKSVAITSKVMSSNSTQALRNIKISKWCCYFLQTTIINGDKADSKILHLYLG
jgi:hypothetical protein